MKKKIVIFICFLVSSNNYAQKDTIVNSLEEVIVLADSNLEENSIGLKVLNLNDSVIQNNRESFTSLIRFNAPIYLKEYGGGGPSSVSFRGTSSSNTAVVWNGININSVNSGQTDFNSLSVNLIDNIDVRSGGGSIKYGSGAIGGTIHLNDDLIFNNQFSSLFISSVGSYATYQNFFKSSYSNSYVSMKVGVSYNESENDYPWLGTSYLNNNGSYKNVNWNLSAALKLSNYSKLKFYFTDYTATRYFSGELPNPSGANDKYKDFNNRSLLVLESNYNQFKHEFKLAYLTQDYNYFSNKDSSVFDFGKSNTFLINYDFTYKLNASAKIDSYSEYTSINGWGSNISVHNRRQFSQSFVVSQTLKDRFSYNLKIRKDFNSDYKVPFVVAFGTEVSLVDYFSLRLNASKNYRVPSYNDLYWPGQGNENLKPETSKQAEIGFTYKNKAYSIDIGYYIISSVDKVIWTPIAGVWVPKNLAKTNNSGLELNFNQNISYKKHQINFEGNYSYILAKDTKTNQFLIFVPKHILNFNLGYTCKKLSGFYQFLFNGLVYTTEDNLEIFSLSSYNVSNIGISYNLYQKENSNVTIGLKINNIYNEGYMTTPRRPMPNRNFNLHINYKF